jgi:uncharacterized RDD family membrane protein YckC
MNPLASRGSRLLAQILDGFVALAIVCAGLLIFYTLGDDGATGALFFATSVVLALLYILLSDGFENGQSYGKRALRISVIDASTGQPCSFGKSLLRNLSLEILGPIDWLFIFSEKRQDSATCSPTPWLWNSHAEALVDD